ncbi:hypothetical protein CIMIT_00145 [Corynebacterium imitans]|uniref:Uncharacterized protein n=1 Tax=Corynebacterium imitans TaxID=156978 RepID=A0A076NGU2_9CORY|nr:hypothetical protein CIMIT_00145 [Corynebacterium imitans]
MDPVGALLLRQDLDVAVDRRLRAEYAASFCIGTYPVSEPITTSWLGVGWARRWGSVASRSVRVPP